MTTLLMSSRHTEDDQALWRAAVGRGWSVARARGIRLPEIDDTEIIIYVEALFSEAIAELVGRKLLDLPEDWLVQLPQDFKKRKISLTTLGQARELIEPSFVKPPNDKSFSSQVYDSGWSLPKEFDDEMPVLVAEPVQWENEYRCFCLDGKVRAVSPYLRSGVHAELSDYAASDDELRAAQEFAESVIAAMTEITPKAVALDVGQIVGQGWAVVEANAAWGSGVYHARIEVVYVEPRWKCLLKQNNGRRKSVPEQVVRKLADKCEPPTWDECHQLLMIASHTGDCR